MAQLIIIILRIPASVLTQINRLKSLNISTYLIKRTETYHKNGFGADRKVGMMDHFLSVIVKKIMKNVFSHVHII